MGGVPTELDFDVAADDSYAAQQFMTQPRFFRSRWYLFIMGFGKRRSHRRSADSGSRDGYRQEVPWREHGRHVSGVAYVDTSASLPARVAANSQG